MRGSSWFHYASQRQLFAFLLAVLLCPTVVHLFWNASLKAAIRGGRLAIIWTGAFINKWPVVC